MENVNVNFCDSKEYANLPQQQQTPLSGEVDNLRRVVVRSSDVLHLLVERLRPFMRSATPSPAVKPDNVKGGGEVSSDFIGEMRNIRHEVNLLPDRIEDILERLDI